MTCRRMLRVTSGRVATVIAATAALLAAGATGAIARTGPGGAPGQPGGTPGQWPMAGQNIDDTHFQAGEHEISPASVGRLAPRWTLTTAGAVSATPTVDDGTVYVPDYGGKLWAIRSGAAHRFLEHPFAPDSIERADLTIGGLQIGRNARIAHQHQKSPRTHRYPLNSEDSIKIGF